MSNPAMKGVPNPQRRNNEPLSIAGLSLACVFLSLLAFCAAELLLRSIDLVTNLAYFGRFSFQPVVPGDHWLGWWAVLIPAVGGLIIGLMARYGSEAIRGHGIPEAMIQVLSNKSRISPKVTVLKPLSAAISIGTGGPFGAEGPIIATGGALGSLVGQIFSTTASERKILLAAGAAAGMTAIFGTPLAAVLLSVELLLFEFRMRSLVPVCVATACAMALRGTFHGDHYFFPLDALTPLNTSSWIGCVIVGLLCGVVATFITTGVYWLEDKFEHLPVHWMWWPCIGGVAVGLIGHYFPQTLGVGYVNIQNILDLKILGPLVLGLCLMKFLSWWIALSSGTSGGTLAPLLTLGAGLGQLLGTVMQPFIAMDIRLAALVGMGALFAGASRALLASALFSVESTGLLAAAMPVLLGCAVSSFVSSILRNHSIMTEKITRRGHLVPQHYNADEFLNTQIKKRMSTDIPLVHSTRSIASFIVESDQNQKTRSAAVVIDDEGSLCGIVTRKDLLGFIQQGKGELSALEAATQKVITAHPEQTLHDAIELMFLHDVARLIVTEVDKPNVPVGYLGRKELLECRQEALKEEHREAGWVSRTRPKV
jgi:H+/Cl- antiporter ClcA